jgi:PqqD family protein of HPr-rel-A system
MQLRGILHEDQPRVIERHSSISLEVRYAAVAGLTVRHLDDEAVVFDPLSWDAHVLNPAALAVLELLQARAQSETEIVSFLSDVLRVEDRPQAASHARRLIGELTSLGLIRPDQDCPVANH